MKEENVKLLMGMMTLGEASESTKQGVYPMVIDGMDPSVLYGITNPSKINGKEWLSSYFPSENDKRLHYFGSPLNKVTHIVSANGAEVPVVKTTPSARLDEETNDVVIGIDDLTGDEIPEMDSIYTLESGQTVSLRECIEQIEEMYPVRLPK